MRYKKATIIKNVYCYLIKNDILIFDSGKGLENHKLFLNREDIGIGRVSDYFYIPNTILFNRWNSHDSFSYDISTHEERVIANNLRIVYQKSNEFIVYKDDIFHYKRENFHDICSSKYFFNILEEGYGIADLDTELLKVDFRDNILWEFPLSSLGDSEYDPGENDRIDKILGIAHGNLWIYTYFGRLIALDVDTGNVLKRISGNPSDKTRSIYEMTLGLGNCFFRATDKNIISVNGFDFQIIDTEKMSIVEKYDFREADPTGIGRYSYVFNPLLQGDYFTFVGEEERESGGCGWVGIFDYKARKLVWKYEIISQAERNATGNHIVSHQQLYMGGDKLYIKDILDNLHIFEREE